MSETETGTETLETLETRPIETEKAGAVLEAATAEEAPVEESDSIFKDKKHYPIFPTGLFDFELGGEELEKVGDSFSELNELGTKNGSDKPNWITSIDMQNLGRLESLSSVLRQAIEENLGFTGVIYDELQITSMRAWRITKSELFPVESRPNQLLAGIFFAKTNKDARVTFFDPRPQAWVIKPPVSEPNIFNSDAFSISCVKNRLLVFPAWLQYQISFKEDMEENIYVTWTAMIRGGATKK